MCQCLQGETTVYNVYLFSNSDSFCAPQWSQSAVQTVRSAMSRLIQGGHKHPVTVAATLIAVTPPFSFFSLNISVFVCVSVYL